jgi:4-aminobutyrate aminotransferase
VIGCSDPYFGVRFVTLKIPIAKFMSHSQIPLPLGRLGFFILITVEYIQTLSTKVLYILFPQKVTMKRRIHVRTKIPGPKSSRILDQLKKKNGGWGVAYPFVHSNEGEGAYFKDIDRNVFLDFGSQIASNPLGYNHPTLKRVNKEYLGRSPIKFAGQDFTVREHLDLLDELMKITPTNVNAGFLINSGAEAVENAIKVSLRKQQKAKFGISFTGAFHGRTLGALSCTNSKVVHKKNYLGINMRRLPFSEDAVTRFEEILCIEAAPEDIGFIILEHVQGEGGYRVADRKMVRGVSRLAKKHSIPYIADEVQAGVGRTGKWWAFEHFGIKPDVITSAKALQVGATLANKRMFPKEHGSISSTWGGGHVLDLANGIATIKTIKKEGLLSRNVKMGKYLRSGLQTIVEHHPSITNIRGLGLMNAFDFDTKRMRDKFILQMLKQGVVLLGCGNSGVRLIPPYVVTHADIDAFFVEMEKALHLCGRRGKLHTGAICAYGMCADVHS